MKNTAPKLTRDFSCVICGQFDTWRKFPTIHLLFQHIYVQQLLDKRTQYTDWLNIAWLTTKNVWLHYSFVLMTHRCCLMLLIGKKFLCDGILARKRLTNELPRESFSHNSSMICYLNLWVICYPNIGINVHLLLIICSNVNFWWMMLGACYISAWQIVFYCPLLF